MAGLLGGVLPALYSGADQVKRRVKGLLTDPRAFLGELNEDAKTAQDQRSAAFYQDYGREVPGGLLGQSDPAWVQQQAQLGREQLQNMALNGLTVWHGSPHKFDKFDASKIGTGEGAQAYGHGLYFAEKPEVAKDYAGNLAAAKSAQPVGNVDLAQAYQHLPNDVPDSLLRARKDFRELEDIGALSPKDRRDFLEAVRNNVVASKGGNLYKVDLPDEAIPKMLEWDKPIAEQSESVRSALRASGLLGEVETVGSKAAAKVRELSAINGVADWAKRDLESVARELERSKSPNHVAGVLKGMQLDFGITPDGGVFKPKAQEFLDFVKTMQYVPNMDVGAGLYALASASRGGEKAASDALREAGIPGIRYLDGGSRGKGDGTRNFVVFPGNEGLLNILERNGQGLLGAK